MPSWRRPFGSRQQDVATDDQSELTDGTMHFVAEKAGNDSGTTYQEATGAPVEVNSPLGYNVGPVTIICLNVSMMIGTGIYSTRKFPISTAYGMVNIWPSFTTVLTKWQRQLYYLGPEVLGLA